MAKMHEAHAKIKAERDAIEDKFNKEKADREWAEAQA